MLSGREGLLVLVLLLLCGARRHPTGDRGLGVGDRHCCGDGGMRNAVVCGRRLTRSAICGLLLMLGSLTAAAPTELRGDETGGILPQGPASYPPQHRKRHSIASSIRPNVQFGCAARRCYGCRATVQARDRRAPSAAGLARRALPPTVQRSSRGACACRNAPTGSTGHVKARPKVVPNLECTMIVCDCGQNKLRVCVQIRSATTHQLAHKSCAPHRSARDFLPRRRAALETKPQECSPCDPSRVEAARPRRASGCPSHEQHSSSSP